MTIPFGVWVWSIDSAVVSLLVTGVVVVSILFALMQILSFLKSYCRRMEPDNLFQINFKTETSNDH